MPKRKAKIVLAAVILVLAAGGAYRIYQNDGDREKGTLQLYGNVDVREVDLTFNNSEHIAELLVQEGDRVKKGQLLARLHRQRLEASAAAAEANVAAQKAALARLEAGSRPEEIRQARADVNAARAKVVDAEITYRRTMTLGSGESSFTTGRR